MRDEKLKQQLQRPLVPADLEASIRANWETQLRTRSHSRVWLAMLASAASLMFVVVLVGSLHYTPDVVRDALEDIANDAKHDVGISIPMETIIAEKHFRAPMQNMPVRLTKYCALDEYRTLHIQVAGARQGEVHLFIQEGSFDIAAWQTHHGEMNAMTWKIIQPRDNFSVLVVYTPEMNPDNVEKLIQHMFYV